MSCYLSDKSKLSVTAVFTLCRVFTPDRRLLTYVSPQFLANMHVDSGGRAAGVRNLIHNVVNGALAGLMNVLAKVL